MLISAADHMKAVILSDLCISARMPGALLESDQLKILLHVKKKLNAFILISIAIVVNLGPLVNFTQAQQRLILLV